MARKRVIVKRLQAIQNFGAMDVLCTDKTGTLTEGRIVLKRYLDIRGEVSERVLEFGYLNSHYQSGLRNMLDVAVLEHVNLGRRLHHEHQYRKLDEIPFDFVRRRLDSRTWPGRRQDKSSSAKGQLRKSLISAATMKLTGKSGRLTRIILRPPSGKVVR